jgi:hypothetical protein
MHEVADSNDDDDDTDGDVLIDAVSDNDDKS